MIFNLEKSGISSLNTMQEEMLEKYDNNDKIVLLSPTGSGKTIAYLLPLLQTIDCSTDFLQALIVVPSRELALQTSNVLKALTSEVRVSACYGGRPTMDEHRVIRSIRPQIIVGTPGRILDHLHKDNFSPQYVHTLVIDEFDKCLEFGFQQQMTEISQLVSTANKRLLLSATDNPHISLFFGNEPYVKFNYLTETSDELSRLESKALSSPIKDKLQTLYSLLCSFGQQTTLVFVNYRESVERVADFLQKNGIYADSFHGGMEQRDREKALYRFSNGSCNVLVCTDLASRGLDIPNIDNVVHYHLPITAEAYIHRNGRTARWTATGASWMILGPEETVPAFVNPIPTMVDLPMHTPKPSAPKWVTIYVGKGKKDKVNKIDIVGFLSKVGQLSPDEIGRIDVMSNWAFVAISRPKAISLLRNIKGEKIKGKKTVFELAE